MINEIKDLNKWEANCVHGLENSIYQFSPKFTYKRFVSIPIKISAELLVHRQVYSKLTWKGTGWRIAITILTEKNKVGKNHSTCY